MGKAQGGGGARDPLERPSEGMSGRLPLIFTGTMSVARGAGATVRETLLAPPGCNIALGIVDATVHLLTAASKSARDRAQTATAPMMRRSACGARLCPNARVSR
jgi:hypothetical protein